MDNILEIKDLKVWFPIKKGVFARTVGQVKAVDGVSFELHCGETLGVVGESGSGKSTVARVITGLQKPTDGSFELRGEVAMVFQDPLGSLNPRMTIRAILQEAISQRQSNKQTIEQLLQMVGLDAAALDKYPHEFSGGQRQRICIARAIATGPELLICDEAVSALDLSVRRLETETGSVAPLHHTRPWRRSAYCRPRRRDESREDNRRRALWTSPQGPSRGVHQVSAVLRAENRQVAYLTSITELNVPWSFGTELAFSGSAHQVPSMTNLYS